MSEGFAIQGVTGESSVCIDVDVLMRHYRYHKKILQQLCHDSPTVEILNAGLGQGLRAMLNPTKAFCDLCPF